MRTENKVDDFMNESVLKPKICKKHSLSLPRNIIWMHKRVSDTLMWLCQIYYSKDCFETFYGDILKYSINVIIILVPMCT